MVVVEVLKLVLFCTLKLIVECAAYFYLLWRWLCCAKPLNNDGVQLGRIIFRHMAKPVDQCHSLMQFISWPSEIVDFTELLCDNYALYSFSNQHVYLVQMPKSLAYYTSRRAPFLFVSLFEEAVSVAKISRNQFVQLTNQLPDPYRLVFVFNVGRCGSTLLAQMSEMASDRVVAYTDPGSYTSFRKYIKVIENGLLSDQDKSVLRALVLYQFRCAIFPNAEGLVCLTKIEMFSMDLALPLKIIFPQSKIVFIDRDAYSIVRSYEKTVGQMVIFQLLDVCARHPWLWPIASKLTNCYPKQSSILSAANIKGFGSTMFETKLFLYTEVIQRYNSYCQQQQIEFHSVHYNDLLENVVEEIEKFLLFCGVKDFIVAKATSLLQEDSQVGTVWSRAALKEIQQTCLTEDVKFRCDAYMAAIGFPEINWPLED